MSQSAIRTPHSALPTKLGFRMPAEWEPQEAVWLSWPHKRSTWPGRFRVIPGVFAGIAAVISRYQVVRINCAAPLQRRAQRLCAAAGADLTRVKFYDHPTNDTWCRDHGPIFVKHRRTGEVAVTDWVFNMWGDKYRPYDLDNRIPGRIARRLGLRRFANPMVLEGGSIDVNGDGLLLTSEQCLLNPNRNPHLTRTQIERQLKDFLGVKEVLWVGEGIVGDDTDGHIDDITRFFRADGFITCVERNRRDPNHRLLAENFERLRGFRTPAGRKFTIVELPMPKPMAFDGQRVPASYANFLIINGAVLVPQFRQRRRDAEARAILADCFPGREIVPIDCHDLIWGLGTLHCISQQQPASTAVS
jgi:agmatine deiminase